jgi:hypothetical protein
MARRAGRATGKVSKSVIKLHDVRTLEGALAVEFRVSPSFYDRFIQGRALRAASMQDWHAL